MSDPVHHPSHYGPMYPGGPECIDVTGSMPFNIGNAVKYCWRAGRKAPDAIEDLRKAGVYIGFEIDRLTHLAGAESAAEPVAATPALPVPDSAAQAVSLDQVPIKDLLDEVFGRLKKYDDD